MVAQAREDLPPSLDSEKIARRAASSIPPETADSIWDDFAGLFAGQRMLVACAVAAIAAVAVAQWEIKVWVEIAPLGEIARAVLADI